MKSLIIISALLIDTACEAGTPKQRAAASIAIARAVLEIAAETPSLPDVQRSEVPRTPNNSCSSTMRMTVVSAPLMSEPMPAQLVIGVWESGCNPCRRLEQEIESRLRPLGWSIGDAEANQIRFEKLPTTNSVPKIELYQNGVVIRTWNEYVDPAFLSHSLRKAWDEATDRPAASQAGSAGAINAKHQVAALLAWWRNNIGERNKCSLAWERTGAQTFPLLAKGDWSARAVFGTYGHVRLAASEPIKLPIQSLGFGYQVRDDDFLFDADPIVLTGYAKLLEPKSQRIPTSSKPVQCVDPMTAWTILSIIKDIYLLLHPTCDLLLPGQLSATAMLNGDVLSIDFGDAPSIKLVALFTFHLKVQRVEVNESTVRLMFKGSRLVKERTFALE